MLLWKFEFLIYFFTQQNHLFSHNKLTKKETVSLNQNWILFLEVMFDNVPVKLGGYRMLGKTLGMGTFAKVKRI